MRGGSPQDPVSSRGCAYPGWPGDSVRRSHLWAEASHLPLTLDFPRGEGGWSPPRVHSELGAREEQWIPAEPEPSPIQGPRDEALLPPHPPAPPTH